MNGEVVIVQDPAQSFADQVAESFAARTTSGFSIALSGGSYAAGCYERLAKADIDWSVVTILWGDERLVPLDDPDSNYLLAKNSLLDRVPAPYAVHPMQASEGASKYEEYVRAALPIDVIHLGMGPDGHTASLFPGVDSALNAPTDRLVIETGDDLHPHPRMTFTYATIDQSRLALFTVAGEGKREMFAKVAAGENFPATHVSAHRVLWLVDSSAAS